MNASPSPLPAAPRSRAIPIPSPPSAAAAAMDATRIEAKPLDVSVVVGDKSMDGGEEEEGEGPCPCVSTACLGPVVPTIEPLKACLSDDSSIEEEEEDNDSDDNDGEGDDDFYFGDVMDMEETDRYFHRSLPELLPPPPSSASLSPSSRRTSCPSLTNSSTSCQSADASSMMDTDGDPDGADIPREIRGFHSYSTGALSRCNTSNSSLFSTRSTNSANKRKKKNGGGRRRVSISNDVHVVPIPQRSEYAPIVRQRLWTSGQELYQNAARNSVEFASEGWNWRSVTEDADMLRHTITKELIHPVHLHNAMQLAQQQAAAANSGNGSGGSGDNNGAQAQRLIAHLPLERNDGPRPTASDTTPVTGSSTNTTVTAATSAASAATVTHHIAAISRVEQHARRAAYQAPPSPTTAARC